MTFDEYQKLAQRTDILGDGKPKDANHPAYVAKILGLVGEAGEVAEKYKKIIRDQEGILTKDDVTNITKELGDVIWYAAMLAKYMDQPFETVAQTNIDKLQARKKRGTLQGKGDNR